MGIHQSITPSQMRMAEAHKARQARFAAAAYKPKPMVASKPIIDVTPMKARKIPEWETGNVTFDAHIVAFQQWRLVMQQLRQFSTGGSVVIHPESFVMPQKRKTVREIADEVLKDFPGITFEDLKSHRRARKVVIPRHLAWYEVHMQRPDMSYPQIGRAFGGFDHTTILSAVKKVAAERASMAQEEAE